MTGANEFIKVDSLIDAKIVGMENGSYELTKLVTYKDTSIKSVIRQPDIRKELSPFTKVLIPPVSWTNNYRLTMDTIGNKQVMLYEATDSSVDLNRFVIHRLDNGMVSTMHFNYRTKNMFTESDQLLIWEEDEQGNLRYRIEGNQHTKFFGKEIYRIEGLLSIKDKE